VTLGDTSAWIEFLRRTGSPVNLQVREAITRRAIAITEPVAMELLAGQRQRSERLAVGRLLAGAELVRVGGIDTWEDAAAIHRVCSAGGHTVRSQLDCLIAAVAIREGVPVLHADRDFDLIAQHTPLQVASV
jgi:predicted nucleic acid-binding protein